MNIIYSAIAVLALILIAFVGAESQSLRFLFAVIIPYLAIILFIIGVVYRVVKWARSPAPFRIPTTCGQQKSLPWIKSSNLENPHNSLGVVARMALEIFFFRSLFRNQKFALKDDQRLLYRGSKYLWLGAIVFHWSLLAVIIRHVTLFTEPAPFFVQFVQKLDGFFQITLPTLYISGVTIIAALAYLLIRRVSYPLVRYISLPSDYFILFLLLGITISGFLMRYICRVDVIAVKELTMGLISFHPTTPERVIPIFYVHLFLVSVLLCYFPMSKLVHMGGIFLSPTRNLANNNRSHRHVNPWNYPVKVHTYEEYEDEFREKMRNAGYPLDKE